MDISQEMKPELLKRKSDILRCPKCHSVFIEKNICESCSYHLNHNPLGEPLGPRSFFYLIEEYLEKKSILFRLFPVLEFLVETASKRTLKRKLLFRLDTLAKHLSSSVSDKKNYRLYVFEMEEIVKRLKMLNFKEAHILDRIENLYTTSLPTYQYIATQVMGKQSDHNMPNFYKKLLQSLIYVVLFAFILSSIFFAIRF